MSSLPVRSEWVKTIMRKLLALILIAGLCAAGCGRKSQPTPTPKNTPRAPYPSKEGVPEPHATPDKEGGPETKGSGGEPNTAPIPSVRPSGTAKLSVGTTMPVTVQKGKEAKTTIPVERDKDTGEITVTFTLPPDSGLTIEPMTAVLHANQTSVNVTVHAAADAKPGKKDVSIKVRGANAGAAGGPEGTGHLDVNVQ